MKEMRSKHADLLVGQDGQDGVCMPRSHTWGERVGGPECLTLNQRRHTSI